MCVCVCFFLKFKCDNDAKALTELDETKGNSAEIEYQLKDAPVLPGAAKHGSMAESFLE